jgi:hypothetical protein
VGLLGLEVEAWERGTSQLLTLCQRLPPWKTAGHTLTEPVERLAVDCSSSSSESLSTPGRRLSKDWRDCGPDLEPGLNQFFACITGLDLAGLTSSGVCYLTFEWASFLPGRACLEHSDIGFVPASFANNFSGKSLAIGGPDPTRPKTACAPLSPAPSLSQVLESNSIIITCVQRASTHSIVSVAGS